MPKLTKAAIWTAKSLNEYAALHFAGKQVENHVPSSPLFWFRGIARETQGVWDNKELRALLTPEVIALLARLEQS